MIAHDSRGIPENARTLSAVVARRVHEALEREVADARGTLGHADHRALRARLVTAGIHAYFRVR